MGVEFWNGTVSTPTVRGCCRFSGFTTTAYPLRVRALPLQGGGNLIGASLTLISPAHRTNDDGMFPGLLTIDQAMRR